ncbi:MAG: hypothetical protein ACI92E_002516 [Oceanicoccus sp.]|jgi:hypothetical protein
MLNNGAIVDNIRILSHYGFKEPQFTGSHYINDSTFFAFTNLYCGNSRQRIPTDSKFVVACGLG